VAILGQVTKPKRATAILIALILAATVANLNLSVANVALPTIGKAFDASQAGLNLVAVGFGLGLAGSVLYLGAVGDRYGRKGLLMLGLVLSIPAALLAGFAPSVEVLFGARIFGGVAAGMAYPTTLALIAALWSGKERVLAIALWSGIGGAMSALGPLTAGWLLGFADWGSVFLITIPLALVTLVLVVRFVPAKVNEGTEPVDNVGGILSVVFVGCFVAAINFIALPDAGLVALVLAAVAVLSGIGFVVRQLRARNPLYDLRVAARRPFWVAAVGGMIVFGSLVGAMYIGQLYLQNVLGYDAFEAGAAILPAAVLLIVGAPIASRLNNSRGGRFTLLLGYALCLAGFLAMLALWRDDSPYAVVAIAYCLIGLGVGMAGPPASAALTSSVPVRRSGMASGTADLQRDLGGAVMQSILGAILTAGYAHAIAGAVAGAPASVQDQVTDDIAAQLQKSYDGAVSIAEQAPEYSDAIIQAAKESFLAGADAAYLAGVIAMLVGAALVFLCYPRHARERELFAAYAAED
jgi:MFS transporter, DHA2 family, multidrug resistance protein